MRAIHLGLAGLALGGLTACSNPMGDPVWSGWDTGAKPVTAYETDGGATTPTGALPPASQTPSADQGYSQYQYAPRPSNGSAPLESAPLPPPPGSSMSPPGSGPRAALPPISNPAPGTLQVPATQTSATLAQPTPPLTVAGLGSEATAAPKVLHKPVTQRTLPLVVSGQGNERSE